MARYTISAKVKNVDRSGIVLNDPVYFDIESYDYPSEFEVKNRVVSFWKHYWERYSSDVLDVMIESVYENR